MATTSFAKAKEAAAATPEPVIDAKVEVVPASEEKTLATQEQAANPYAGVEGEFDARDINLPYLSLVQKTSDLIDAIGCKPGSFVYNKEVVISEGKDPVNIVVTRLSKYYEEAVEYGSGDEPQTFKTIKEARAAGFDDQWDAEKRVVKVANMDVLLPCPANATEVQKDYFSIEIDGGRWALGRWTVRKGAYKTTASEIITALQLGTFLKNGLHTGMWKLTSKLESNAKNSWYAPILKPAGATPEAVVKFLENFLRG